MLFLKDQAFFCTSRATFSDAPQGAMSSTARIFVRFRLSEIDAEFYALLDTGAPYSILDPEVAETAGIQSGSGESRTLSTRLGDIEGELVRHDLTLCADDGDSLTLDTTIFIPRQSMGGSFLGYTGLESIRIGLDLSQNHFYFGKA